MNEATLREKPCKVAPSVVRAESAWEKMVATSLLLALLLVAARTTGRVISSVSSARTTTLTTKTA